MVKEYSYNEGVLRLYTEHKDMRDFYDKEVAKRNAGSRSILGFDESIVRQKRLSPMAIIEVVPNAVSEEFPHEMHFIENVDGELTIVENYFYFDLSTEQTIFRRGTSILTQWLTEESTIKIPSFELAKRVTKSDETLFFTIDSDKGYKVNQIKAVAWRMDSNKVLPTLLVEGPIKAFKVRSANASKSNHVVGLAQENEFGIMKDAKLFFNEEDANAYINDAIEEELKKEEKRLSTLRKQLLNKLKRVDELKRKLSVNG